MPNEYKNYNERNKLENYEENLEPEDSLDYPGDNQDDYANSSEGYSSTSNSLSKSQKIGVVSLAFFALFVVILWSIQFKNSINEPFNRSSSSSSEEEASVCASGNCDGTDSEEALKNKDTDSDGLSDWDELNIYGTSPYLEDSDSDGFLDKAEIDSDNDPNCPTGRNCFSVDTSIENADGENIKNSINLNDYDLTGLLGADSTGASVSDSQVSSEILNIGDAASLRQLLLESGIDEELLSLFSDEELMQTFIEMSQEAE